MLPPSKLTLVTEQLNESLKLVEVALRHFAPSTRGQVHVDAVRGQPAFVLAWTDEPGTWGLYAYVDGAKIATPIRTTSRGIRVRAASHLSTLRENLAERKKIR